MKIIGFVLSLAGRALAFALIGIICGGIIGAFAGGLSGATLGVLFWVFDPNGNAPAVLGIGNVVLGFEMGVGFGIGIGIACGAIALPAVLVGSILRRTPRFNLDHLDFNAGRVLRAAVLGAWRGALSGAFCGSASGLLLGLAYRGIVLHQSSPLAAVLEPFDGEFFRGAIIGFILGFFAGALFGGLGRNENWFNAPLSTLRAQAQAALRNFFVRR